MVLPLSGSVGGYMGTPYSIRQRSRWDVTWRTVMKDNQTIAAIRRVRREISRRVDFDPKWLIDFYKERQKVRTAKGPAKPER